jgi:hypothetical protein
MVKLHYVVGALGSVVLVGVACNGILGIDVASVDPNLTVDAGACGTYCNAVVANCPGADYNDVPTCLTMCPAFDPGTPNDTTQDTLGCRLHYALAAANDKTQCAAAGAIGGNVCGNDPCRTFCNLDAVVCTGTNTVYDGGPPQCLAECQANFGIYLLDAGSDLALYDGNTINCRLYHLEAALGNPEPGSLIEHCPHTALVSVFCIDDYDGPHP